MITKNELQAQTEALVKMVGLNTPRQIGVCVIMFDNQTGLLCVRAVKMTRERVKETLHATLKGYGDQVTTEGVDL